MALRPAGRSCPRYRCQVQLKIYSFPEGNSPLLDLEPPGHTQALNGDYISSPSAPLSPCPPAPLLPCTDE